MAQINIRMDDALKESADELFDELGLNMTTAFTMFVKTAVRRRGIPFEVTIDPFYSESNMAHLREAVAALNAGKGVIHELIEVEDDE